MEVDDFNSTYSHEYYTKYDTILVYVLLVERVIMAVLFGIIIRHWIIDNFTMSRPRLEVSWRMWIRLGDCWGCRAGTNRLPNQQLLYLVSI